MAKIYFVSAGPGDPELMTIKARRILDQANEAAPLAVIIYAASLINPEIIKGIKAEVVDSSKMTLEEIINIMTNGISMGKMVIRLHSGDTSFYSAISEQIEMLRELDIEYEVIPGVSSAMAGAAMLGQELTIPEISQTVIFTRLAGRTPVPETERLQELAKHRATMVIFLSAGMVKQVRNELLVGYPEDTPVVIIKKISYPDERLVRGELKDLVELSESIAVKKTALIYVGQALKASEMPFGKKSLLYSQDFKHEYRK